MRECLRHAAVRLVAGDMATASVCSCAGQVVARSCTSEFLPPSVGGHGDTIKDDTVRDRSHQELVH